MTYAQKSRDKLIHLVIMSSSTLEMILNRASIIALIVAGVFFIYEGAVLVDMHRSNPRQVPAKIAVAGSLTIFLGVLSLAFVAVHLFLDGSFSGYMKALKSKTTNASTA